MDKILAELKEAEAAFLDAKQASAAANRKETDARNRLNQAQKTFDAAVADMKREAPGGSDWKAVRVSVPDQLRAVADRHGAL